MQLIAQRYVKVTELHMVAVEADSSGSRVSNSSSPACVSTLLPLRHVLADLYTLVLEGVAVKHMREYLHDLAAAAAAMQG